MQLNYEKRILLQVSIIGVTVLAIAAAIIYPTVKYIQTMNQETQELKTYMEKRYEATQHLRQSRLKADAIKDSVASYQERIFQAEDQLKLITTLEELATKNHTTQKIENLETDNKNNQLKISLEAEGKYEDALNYFVGLEKLDYFLNITHFNFSPSLGKNAEVTSSTKMQIEATLYVNS